MDCSKCSVIPPQHHDMGSGFRRALAGLNASKFLCRFRRQPVCLIVVYTAGSQAESLLRDVLSWAFQNAVRCLSLGKAPPSPPIISLHFLHFLSAVGFLGCSPFSFATNASGERGLRRLQWYVLQALWSCDNDGNHWKSSGGSSAWHASHGNGNSSTDSS